MQKFITKLLVAVVDASIVQIEFQLYSDANTLGGASASRSTELTCGPSLLMADINITVGPLQAF